ncbi:hypothetical protein FH972_011480 [Carpinus fangiana]|uniref:Uncharacterized protein n=1 Tax=Carpinus fangiana TaxID=176857 RepID=A0A660KTB1_9ROSI|nr:hypothetical protein FH972_011480 [Carpinus fangiana]
MTGVAVSGVAVSGVAASRLESKQNLRKLVGKFGFGFGGVAGRLDRHCGSPRHQVEGNLSPSLLFYIAIGILIEFAPIQLPGKLARIYFSQSDEKRTFKLLNSHMYQHID